MKKILLIGWFCCGLCFHSQAQMDCKHVVEGKVFDLETKEPLPFASVIIEGTTKGTKTNLDGSFKIENLCQTELHLV